LTFDRQYRTFEVEKPVRYSVPRLPGDLNMRRLVAVAFVLAGCASLPMPEAPDTLPQLIYQVPLPAWPHPAVIQDVPLELMIRVAADGSVSNASLVTSSGNTEWDTLALAAVRQWRFSPARNGPTPIPTWIRQKVRVHFEAPSLMTLRELTFADQQFADSLYVLLQLGSPFDSLARTFSVSKSRARGGFLGEIDIRAYPSHIRRTLSSLHAGEFTKPLPLGDQFVIFKRESRFR
jgi:TonB family protein